MRVAKLTSPKQIQLFDQPSPGPPGPGKVLVRVKAVGICGTDLHVFQGERADVALPRVMGHELAGVVERTGDGVSGLAEGDHVVFDPVVPCGVCKTCRSGHQNVCGEVKCFGVQMDGGFQEQILVDRERLYPISPAIPFRDAALAEPFSVAANILGRAQPVRGESLVILGAGAIGLALLQAARMMGLRVLITDIEEQKLASARELGADLAVNTRTQDLAQAVESFCGGADLLVDAVGVAPLTQQLVDLAAPCARIVVIGFDGSDMKIPPVKITKKELTLVGSRMNNLQFPKVVEWMEKGLLNLGGMVSSVYPLEDIQRAFEDTLANSAGNIKTIIEL